MDNQIFFETTSFSFIDDIKSTTSCDESLHEGTIVIDLHNYIKDIVESLPTKKQVWRQLGLDIPRCNIFVNDNKVHSVNYLERLLRRYHYYNKTTILSLCTQACMGYPLEIFQKKFKCIIGEPCHSYSRQKMSIKLTANKSSTFFCIEKTLQIYFAQQDELSDKLFKCKIEFDLSRDKYGSISYQFVSDPEEPQL